VGQHCNIQFGYPSMFSLPLEMIVDSPSRIFISAE